MDMAMELNNLHNRLQITNKMYNFRDEPRVPQPDWLSGSLYLTIIRLRLTEHW